MKKISAVAKKTAVLVAAVFAFIFSPQTVAVASFLAGSGLAVAGVYILFGSGWALLAGAVPFLILAVTLIRGLHE